MIIGSCKTDKMNTEVLEKDNLIAWCIVPFDANERGPEARAEMLNELGISKLAYDYRDHHIPTLPREIQVLQEHDIELSSVWLWIQDSEEGLLDPSSEKIVSIVEEAGVHTEFWISFPHQFFDGLSDQEKLDKSVQTISKLNQRLLKSGCSIALYNHGDWFGNPINQITIIEEIGSENIGIVYNFHHAHHEMEQFDSLFLKMMPYLTSVNLNGMTPGGEKIIDIGKGEKELEMIRFMLEQGYDGPIGILGHTQGEDIKKVLERNLEGLEEIRNTIQSED